MTISFNDIPNNQLTPFVYVEFDNSNAVSGPGVMPLKTLLIGNRLSTGSVDEGVPTQITSVDQAESFFGKGSTLADMARAHFANNQSNETWAVGLDDGDGAAQASGSFEFSGTASENGTLYCYIGGYRVPVGVDSGDSGADIATALQTELAKTEYSHIPVNYGGTSGTVDIEVKNGGEFGNSLDLRTSYYNGEKVPAGITVTLTQPTGGSGNPDVADALTAIGDEQFHVMVHPYTDTSNLNALRSELLSRWGPLTQNDGVAITAKDDTYGNLSTFGDARNSQFEVAVGLNNSPTPPWRIAAAVGASVAYYGQIDPARPFQTLELTDVLPPAIGDRFTQSERNLLLGDGIATLRTTAGGSVVIDRLVTTYKTNSLGATDPSYRDLNTIMILSYLRWDWRNYILRKYPRHKLADDGTRFAQGQKIVTPSLMKSEAILKFTEWESIGLVENLAMFKENLIVERNGSDVNRLDVLLPPNLINQLIVVATQMQFRL